ncbi:MAG: GGDEF domain-containing protein [Xanthobacteraceae bacterium]|nr:MAG: GGDEF domain-containing protein [Xanthobacteraceae bacterium]
MGSVEETRRPAMILFANSALLPGVARPDLAAHGSTAQRTIWRRKWLAAIFASYCIDIAILSLYAATGVVPWPVPLAYFAATAAVCATFLMLSEINLISRAYGHYLTIWQLIANAALHLVFVLTAPQVGFVFLGILFIVYGFAAMRLTGREAVVSLAVTAAGLAAFIVLPDQTIHIPSATRAERIITALFLMLTLARCLGLGLYASRLREQLYRRGRQLKQAVHRIEELAEIDELTGTLNRRSIMKAITAEIDQTRRTQMPLCIAMIDLDWFKIINDRFGHPVGDEVLRTFAITLCANMRAADKLGRYGGEEFMLAMPNTSEQAADSLLRRLIAISSSLDWSDVMPDVALTFSAGIARMRPDDTLESLVARADIALYDSKQGGRNCVKVAA